MEIIQADNPHQPLAVEAGQGIDLINLLDQPSPIPIGFFVFIWFQGTGNEDILIFLLTKSPGDVTIKAVIANHLFSLVG